MNLPALFPFARMFRPLLCAVITSTLFVASATAQTAPAEQQPQQPSTAVTPAEPQTPASQPDPAAEKEASELADAANPCHVIAAADEKRLDQYRREIFETICGT